MSNTSFVWDHFEKSEDGTNRCTVVKKNGEICNSALAKDKSSSTKSMIVHLKTQHGIIDPAKKGKHANIDVLMKTGTLEVNDKLNIESLKTHVVYLVADADLPFSIVERLSFLNLLKLCNPSTEGMQVKRHAIAAQAHKIFEQTQEYVTEVELKKSDFVSVTTDAWTSPNNKAFMAITVHTITEDFVKKDFIIGLPQITGQHTGAKFGSILVEYLQKYGITNSLSSITADNASTNSTMARSISEHPDINFDPETQLFGCIAHVLDLAARDGLSLFGVIDETEEQELSMNAMDISNLVQPPDGCTIDLSSITRRIHGLVVHVRSSPQQAEAFANIVKAMRSLGGQKEHVFESEADPEMQDLSLQEIVNEPEDQEPPTQAEKSKKTVVALIIDVKTRWNSTYLMFLRVLRLRSAVVKFSERPDCKKFNLSQIEWDQLEQMCNFLEPLWEATNQMCRSRFPTMQKMIPMYISVMKGLKRVEQMYDHDKLLPAAANMIKKLHKYFSLIIKKPAAICATILDPRIKMTYFEKEATAEFLAEYNITPLMLKDTLIRESRKFRSDSENSFNNPNQPRKQSRLDEEIYGDRAAQGSFTSELHRYLGEMTEDYDTEALEHWKLRALAFPTLSRMARCYLAIPATSAPSESVFSKAKKVLSPQRSRLACCTVKVLVCLKDWYCVFRHLYHTVKSLPSRILPIVVD